MSIISVDENVALKVTTGATCPPHIGTAYAVMYSEHGVSLIVTKILENPA
jgi:hypothetical protein